MRQAMIIAGQEIRNGLRNRWVLATALLLAGLALVLAFVGSAPAGSVGVGSLTVTVVSLASLTIFLVPLIALLLSFDTLVGEAERGTLLLLLAYPVSRWQVLLGKFLGQTAILAFATILGYGVAGLAIGLTGGGGESDGWRAFTNLIGSSILLGAAFAAIGSLISAVARQRGSAAGLAVAAWLGFVVLFDLALLGALVVDQGRVITAPLFQVLLLLNPADAYRLFNLTGSAEVSVFAGMAGPAGAAAAVHPGVLLAVLLAWVLLPLTLAALVFQRREV